MGWWRSIRDWVKFVFPPNSVKNSWAPTQAWLSTWLYPPRRVSGADETVRWARSYPALRDDGGAEDGVYSLARKYAKERYEELVKLSESLDAKLESLARTALALGAITATAVRVAGIDTAYLHSPRLVIGTIFWVLTVLIAALSRRPNERWEPMSSRSLLEVADLTPKLPKSRIDGALAASYHVATSSLDATADWKSRQLARATWLFCLGLSLFASLAILPP